jgi:hypothetical protein
VFLAKNTKLDAQDIKLFHARAAVHFESDLIVVTSAPEART